MFDDLPVFKAENVDDRLASILLIGFAVQVKDDQIALGKHMRKDNMGFRMCFKVAFKISIKRFSTVRDMRIVLDVLVANVFFLLFRRLMLIER